MSGGEDERARAIALLEATHEFPVEYDISIIAINAEMVGIEVRDAVVLGLTAALPEDAYENFPSSGGRYLSHRFRVPCRTADDVLELYARVRRVKGVVTVL